MSKPHPISASLYVGELLPDITESKLFEIFNQVGPVASIRVCRDAITRRSLGYAYVNFHNVVDAERSLDTLNNHQIRGKPCRIMWSQRDPSIRKSGVGNIFIKNLDLAIGHKELHDTFSVFGNILSCKVATDENGQSKGYGFVHFEGNESADKAIAKVNGMIMGNMKVYVGRFIPKKDWLKQKETSWTNVFVKNLAPNTTDDELRDMFKEFGPITSCVMMRDSEAFKAEQDTKVEQDTKAAPDTATTPTPTPAPDTAPPAADGAATEGEASPAPVAQKEKSKDTGFGFVNFKYHEDAVKAVETMNGKTIDGSRVLYCGRAQKKAERVAELKKKFEQLKLERMTKYQGINLYIKNLEDDITEERLRKEFGVFGKIKSIKIMDDGKGGSKGFGFVCFTTPEEANRCMTEMNGRILNGCTKPLYVNMHEPKEIRRQKLAAQHAARIKGMRPQGPMGGPQGIAGQPGVPGPIPMGYAGAPVFYAAQPGAAGMPGPQQGGFISGYPPNQVMPRGAGRWPAPQPGGPQGGPIAGPMGQGIPPNFVMQPMAQRGGPQGGQRGGPQGGQRGGPQGQPNGQQGRGPQGQRGVQGPRQQPQGGIAQTPQVAAPVANQQAIPSPGELTIQQLQAYSPEQQKMLLGERLYQVIHKKAPVLAGKITGMLLEGGYVEELFHMLENEEALDAKVEEAVRVLEDAKAKPEAGDNNEEAAKSQRA